MQKLEKNINFFIGGNSLKALHLNWGPISRNFFWTFEKLEVPLCSAPLKTHVPKNSDHEIPNSARNIWVFTFPRYNFFLTSNIFFSWCYIRNPKPTFYCWSTKLCLDKKWFRFVHCSKSWFDFHFYPYIYIYSNIKK